MNRILIAGGTGFIGKKLTQALLSENYKISLLTRREDNFTHKNLDYYLWDVSKNEIDSKAFENVDTIINLTGSNISEKKWTEKRKEELFDSRVKAINLLFDAVEKNKIPIKTFLSSSAVGIYGAITSDEIFDEESLLANDFLGSLCQSWEKAAQQFESLNSRVVMLRKGVVLGKEGGIYKKMAPFAKFGINTSLGSGKQYLPWIELEDTIRMYLFFLKNTELKGVFNAVASEDITMNQFVEELLSSFKKKSFLPNAPELVVKLMFGEMAMMLLKGSRVSNKKLLNTGFEFKNSSLSEALRSIKNSVDNI